VKVLVVDDEAHARDRLADLVGDLDDFEVVGKAKDGHSALSMAESEAPDIVLMDIRMPGMDGIEAARHMAVLETPPAVIFTTAYDSYTLEAFEASAVGYIMKPVRRQRLADALNRASRLTRAQISSLAGQQRPDKRSNVCSRVRGKLRLIPIDEIIYFRADQKYVSVHHLGGEDLIDETIKALAGEFEAEFARIHRNALVALGFVESVEPGDSGKLLVHMRHCDEPLLVSRRHAGSFRKRVTS
jgi:two-component system response regulator AlgR